jgi:hypothetical protein
MQLSSPSHAATRRSFIQRAVSFMGALAVSGGTMFLVACASVANDLLTAFQSVLDILSGAGLVPGGALVVTALNNVLAAVQAYENAPSADKGTLGEKLATIISIAQAQLQSWFTGLNLTGTLATVIESLVAVILATLAGLLPTLPSPPTQPDEVRSAKALPRQIGYVPVATITITRGGLKSASETFRLSFNSALVAGGFKKAF